MRRDLATAQSQHYELIWRRKDWFNATTITRLINKFETTFTLLDKSDPGRKSLVEERTPRVAAALASTSSNSSLSSLSVRCISKASDIPSASVKRILRHHLNLYPYQLHLLQELNEVDKEMEGRLTLHQLLYNFSSALSLKKD